MKEARGNTMMPRLPRKPQKWPLMHTGSPRAFPRKWQPRLTAARDVKQSEATRGGDPGRKESFAGPSAHPFSQPVSRFSSELASHPPLSEETAWSQTTGQHFESSRICLQGSVCGDFDGSWGIHGTQGCRLQLPLRHRAQEGKGLKTPSPPAHPDESESCGPAGTQQ